ncbi:exodeoxyribonuclease III [Kribbia dieselivorans]|uniref:exodeoxyribonuclease III n=1 Tax=Kribbia dieselivorans TaxID=331526 RepID=UPI000839A09D|nr:exodeoxyribonuclease III [Kribbia dieselivorans]
MRLVSANVNGIRAAQRRGGLAWLQAQQADVVTLQEVRASDDQLRKVLADEGFGHWPVAHAPAAAKGRAGVAILTRTEPTRISSDLAADFDEAGRWVEVDVQTEAGPLTVASVYVHTGEADTDRQVEKYRFLDVLTQRMREWRDDGRRAVITGDLNIGHTEHDIKNWKGNRGKSGFLPQERAYLDRWFTELGWVDVHRALHGPGPGPYTWWSWRGKAFDNDSGWRIDYQLATSPLAQTATAAVVGRAESYDQRWSDHAAVSVDYDL